MKLRTKKRDILACVVAARGPGPMSYKFLVRDFRKKLVLVPGKPFQPSLLFLGKYRSLP
jgi:hypothetical protein